MNVGRCRIGSHFRIGRKDAAEAIENTAAARLAARFECIAACWALRGSRRGRSSRSGSSRRRSNRRGNRRGHSRRSLWAFSRTAVMWRLHGNHGRCVALAAGIANAASNTVFTSAARLNTIEELIATALGRLGHGRPLPEAVDDEANVLAILRRTKALLSHTREALIVSELARTARNERRRPAAFLPERIEAPHQRLQASYAFILGKRSPSGRVTDSANTSCIA